MSSASSENGADRVEYWNKIWESNDLGFHQMEAHVMLVKYFGKLTNDGRNKKVLVPLCGKTVDMKWLVDQGMEVVGVDGVKMALEQFYTEQGLRWTEERVPGTATETVVLKSDDGKMRLYNCDVMTFSTSFEGTYDAVWDRGGLVALVPQDVPKYVELMKKLLNPGGQILVEVMEYDLSIMDDVDSFSKPPPPYTFYENELNDLYGPECEVKFLERTGRLLRGKDIIIAFYLITKKNI